MNSIELIAFTQKGCQLALEVARGLGKAPEYAQASCAVCGPERFAADLGIEAYESLDSWAASRFGSADALVFVGASGIAVRAIAPYVRDKFTDPAVVSVDEAGRFVVPLLSGHVGGANGLARAIAGITDGQAVVSTATDVNNLFAVDEWAMRNGFALLERDIAKDISAALLEGRTVGFKDDFGLDWELPAGVTDGAADIGFAVSLDDACKPFDRTLHLVPRVVTVGVGCRRGTAAEVLRKAVYDALAEARISPIAVSALASIDVKKDEPAIRALALSEQWSLRFYAADQLAAVPGEFTSSEFVARTVGVDNVCERAACAEGATLAMEKHAGDGVTVALAFKQPKLDAPLRAGRPARSGASNSDGESAR